MFFINYFLSKTSLIFLYVIIYCVGARITTLMYISDGLDPYFFFRNIENMRSMKEKMDGEVFISRQSWHFPFVDKMIRVLFPICTLLSSVNNYVSRQGKGINRTSESTIIIIKIVFF